MTIVRIIVALSGLILGGAILWAATQSGSYANGGLHGNLFEQGSAILTLPWGKVTMLDLYIGFVLFAVIIFVAEKSWLVAALWIAPLPFLGNVWAAVWLLVRLPHLAKQLSRPDWPTS
ncbi:MAG: hypothetical protein ACOYKM_01640 [Caulobacterales bacterium]|jgi:hypothetical protein